MDVPQLQESLDRLAKKQRLSYDRAEALVDDLLADLLAAKARIESSFRVQGTASATPGAVSDACSQQVGSVLAQGRWGGAGQPRGALQEVAALQREGTAVVTKLGKGVERAFPADLGRAHKDVPTDVPALSLEVVRHLYRLGLVAEGDCYSCEAGLGEAESRRLRGQYQVLHQIVEQLRQKRVERALQWAQEHRLDIMLGGGGMNLEFGLHRLQFLHHLQQHGKASALHYARRHFGAFGGSHMEEIKRLMGALLWAGRLQDSPYADLPAALHWDAMATTFAGEYLSVMGEAARSPLECVLAAGAQAAPQLGKLALLMASKPQEWRTLKQLPVEIELARDFQFHSVFACPVSREQSSADNPPMLLPCCHVLCKHSVLKLAKGNSRPFKCPYCPMETTPSSCRPIQF